MQIDSLSFAQGVDDLLGGTYVRNVANGRQGLFVMNSETGEWSRKFPGLMFLTVSLENPRTVVGLANDGTRTFAYRAHLETRTLDHLGYVPVLDTGKYALAQGDYDYDPVEHDLYLSALKGHAKGFLKVDLDRQAVSFEPEEASYNVVVIDGEPRGVFVPAKYSYPQGVMAYDSIEHKAYTTGSTFDENGRFDSYGIVVMAYSHNTFHFEKFIDLGIENYFSNITYDADVGKFFGERSLGRNTLELVAIDFHGDVFTLGTSVANNFEGGEDDDYYMGLGGEDVLFGDLGDDKLEGGVGNDALKGGTGDDLLWGQEGRDRIGGGKGEDTIWGGEGKDKLSGGPGEDTFDFNSSDDSLVGRARDQISDFARGQDHIDLSGIDAKTGSGNQTFKWIGSHAFNNFKGELRYDDLGEDIVVQGDTNGDGNADFEIFVAGVGKLGHADLIL